MMPILKNTFSKIDHVRGEKSDDQFRHIGLRYIKVANSKQDRFGFSSLQFFFLFTKSAANININMSVKKHLPSAADPNWLHFMIIIGSVLPELERRERSAAPVINDRLACAMNNSGGLHSKQQKQEAENIFFPNLLLVNINRSRFLVETSLLAPISGMRILIALPLLLILLRCDNVRTNRHIIKSSSCCTHVTLTWLFNQDR